MTKVAKERELIRLSIAFVDAIEDRCKELKPDFFLTKSQPDYNATMILLNDMKMVSFYRDVPKTIDYLTYCKNVEPIAKFFDMPTEHESIIAFKQFEKALNTKIKTRKPF